MERKLNKMKTKAGKNEKAKKRKHLELEAGSQGSQEKLTEPEDGSIASHETPSVASSASSTDKKRRRLLPEICRRRAGSVANTANVDGPTERVLKGSKPVADFKDMLDARLIENLKARDIKSLFEIQVKTLLLILNGEDVIGRARTGMGKTLAFALPILQQLIADKTNASAKGYRNKRNPRVVVLAPTRELAKQVSAEFEKTSDNLNLRMLCVYGGVSISEQIRELHIGIDVIVGTPGRILDHIQRGTLNLSEVKHFVLDEADQMLDMGFKDDIDAVFDAIINSSEKAVVPGIEKAITESEKLRARRLSKGLQVLLFSATVPSWVKDVSKTKMNDAKMIDLVGDMESASKDVEHVCLQCPWQTESRSTLILDLVRLYAGSKVGRTIVFCNTKKQCNELSTDKKLVRLSKTIHGDISQQQRESTLAGFRKNVFKILIATDVAARGLDIKDVDLVVNCEPPSVNQFHRGNASAASRAPARADVDTYVHRSGRTGRAGKKGVCVTLFTPKQQPLIKQIEQKTSNTLKRVGAPQLSDLVLGGCRSVAEDLMLINKSVSDHFSEFAEELLEYQDAKEMLSCCLAKLTGFEEPGSFNKKSLMGSEVGYVTVVYQNRQRFSRPGEMRLGYVWSLLRKVFDNNEDLVEQVKGMTLLKAEDGAVFDLPQKAAEELEKRIKQGDNGVEGFSICSTLPETKLKENARGPSSFSNGYRSNQYSNGGGGGRGRGGYGRSFGKRGGRGRGRGRGSFGRSNY